MRLTKIVITTLLILWAGIGWTAPNDPNDLLALPAIKTTQLAKSAMMDICLAGERVVMVGEMGRIGYSDDHGKSWQQAQVPVSVTLTAVDFPTADQGWAVGHDGVILRSIDGGASWQLQLDGNQVNSIVLGQVNNLLAQMDNRIAAATDADRADLEFQREDLSFFLSDAQMAMREGATRPFMDLLFLDERRGFVIGSFGMIFRTNDGGAHWEPLIDRMDNPDGFHYYAITRSGDSLFIAGEVGLLFRSDDLGESWQRLETPYEGSFFGINGHPQGDHLLVYGLGGNTFVSQNAGESWTAVDKPKTGALSAGAITGDNRILLIAYDGTNLQSTDGGRSFQPQKERFPGSVAIQSLTHDKHLVVGLNGVRQLATETVGN